LESVQVQPQSGGLFWSKEHTGIPQLYFPPLLLPPPLLPPPLLLLPLLLPPVGYPPPLSTYDPPEPELPPLPPAS